MDIVLEWGIDVVLWFQQFSPALDLPFRLLTLLGDREFFMLMLPLVYWCIDRNAGIRLIFLFLVSVYVNQAAKALLDQPRPFEFDSRVRRLVHAPGGGLPSGHTQGAVVVWGFLALSLKKTWFWVVATFLMVGIPLSRIYLGAHFPTDLLGGYLIGGLLLFGYLGIGRSITARVAGLNWMNQLYVAILVPLVLTAVFFGSGGYGVMLGGVSMGLAVGLVIERRTVRFKNGGGWLKRLGAYVLGIVMLFFIYYGLRVSFADLEPAPLWRFVRYALVGAWGTLGAPWVLVKLKLLPIED